MKLTRIFLSAGAALMMLTACDQTATKSSSSDINPKNQELADSLIVTLGQMIGNQYFAVAERDSNYSEADSKEQFLNGFKQGITDITERQAYNDGVLQGAQLALHLQEMNKRYHVNVTPQAVIESLSKTLKEGALDEDAVARLQIEYHKRMVALEKSLAPAEPAQPAAVPADTVSQQSEAETNAAE